MGKGLKRSATQTKLLALLVALTFAFTARAEMLVVATTPDLASIAALVAGDLVRAESLVPPAADPEAFEPKPGHLARLRAADLVVRVGLGFDHWLDRLLAETREKRLMKGGAAHVDASIGIPLLEVQGRSVEAGAGHAHGAANPHYWLDPANGEIIGSAIAEALLRLMPQEQSRIIERHERFVGELRQRVARWTERLEPHRGAAVLAYHNTWPYFARRFRLNVVGVIEPKEGVPPSPARLARLSGLMREQRVRAILVEPFAPAEAPSLLARRGGAAIALLAPSVGAVPEADDYFALFERNLEALARALANAGG